MIDDPSSAPALRVAYQSPGWPPGAFSNGIVTYVAHVRAGLRRVGVQTRVLAAETAGPVDSDVTELGQTRPDLYLRLLCRLYEKLQGRDAIEFRFGQNVARAFNTLCERWPADLLEVEESFGLGAFVAAAVRAPVVVRLHGPWFIVADALGLPRDAAYHHRVRWERRAMAGAAGVSSPSQHVLDLVRQTLHLPLSDAAVIPNPAPPVPPAERFAGDGAAPPTVLFVGRFDRLKGADVLIDAFARLAARHPTVRLTLVGPDRGLRDQQGRTWSWPDFSAAQIPPDLQGRIDFRGELPAHAVAPLRRSAAVTVMASRYETFPMTVLEAMAFGSPLIASRVGGVPEMVRDGDNGLLVPPGDVDALAVALDRLLSDRPLARRLGDRAAQDAATTFSPEQVARRSRTFYEDVVARFRARRR